MARDYDYRGGSASIDPNMQRAIANIRAGNTPRQKREQFNNKLIMAGIQGSVAGLSGLIKANQSSELQEKQKIMSDAIAKASKTRDEHNAWLKTNEGAEVNGDPVVAPYKMASEPAMKDPTAGGWVADSRMSAKDALARITKDNDAAAAHPANQEAMMADAEADGADINRVKSLVNMNSFSGMRMPVQGMK